MKRPTSTDLIIAVLYTVGYVALLASAVISVSHGNYAKGSFCLLAVAVLELQAIRQNTKGCSR